MSTTVRVQLVVYRLPFVTLRRTVAAVRSTLAHAARVGALSDAVVAIGDCSPERSLTPDEVAALTADLKDVAPLSYHFFDDNLGSAGGSNRLAALGDEPVIWVLNPDTYPAPTCLEHLLAALAPTDVAAVEARQIPVEHPKAYHPITGDAEWVTGACMLLKRSAFDAVGGFDAHTFPMYCDDVDLSWRLRLAGWRLRTVPRAVVVHDKRLGPDGQPFGSDLEIELGSEARLLLTRRYNRPDVTSRDLALFLSSASDAVRRGADRYQRRIAAGDEPEALDGSEGIADFDRRYYGAHRFRYGA